MLQTGAPQSHCGLFIFNLQPRCNPSLEKKNSKKTTNSWLIANSKHDSQSSWIFHCGAPIVHLLWDRHQIDRAEFAWDHTRVLFLCEHTPSLLGAMWSRPVRTFGRNSGTFGVNKAGVSNCKSAGPSNTFLSHGSNGWSNYSRCIQIWRHGASLSQVCHEIFTLIFS